MAELPKGLDPNERDGVTGEISKRGLYVFEAKDELDNKVGTPKYLEANDPAQADAFVHLGFRKASEQEVRDYLKSVEEARQEARNELKKSDELPDTLSESREAVTSVKASDIDSKAPVTGTTAEGPKKESK